MRVLVTGARGFIGRSVARALSQRHEVFAPHRAELELLDAAGTRAWLASHRVDVVIHAATTPGHRNAPPVPDLYQRNLRMFDALATAHAGRMIVLGSGSEYDMTRPLELVGESAFGERRPAEASGRSKYEISRVCERDPRFTVLRLFGVFGPGEDWEIRFISNALCKAIFGRPITLRQDRKFHYLWVDDLAPVLERILAGPTPHAAYNVTPDEVSSLADLARQVVDVAGADVPIQIAQAGEGLPYTGSNARLKADFPGLAFTPTRAAIERLHAWYAEHRDQLDPRKLDQDK